MTPEESEKEYHDLMAGLDEAEQMIMRAAIIGLGRGVLTHDRLKVEVPDMLDRHRTGKPVLLDEIYALYIPKPEATAA